MTMRDVMLDLETMGNGPRAAIVAIGAVEFDPETGTVGERFYQAVDLATAVSMGGEMDASTVLWWMQQGDEARAAFAKGGAHLSKALMDFSTWLHERGAPDDVRVWGNGAAFDNVILASAYRAAMRLADVMVFNSHYMHEAYRRNAGFDCRRPVVAYQGINEGTFADAGRLGNQVARDALRILSVSAMARHKDVETLLRALVLVRQRFAVPARLDLVGAWPDPAYRTEMESLCHALGLDDAVSFRGHVSAEELHRCYAAAQVFCLMSRCESFGIPAVEAQCFGTPVVSSNCCAIPEVCGEGGVYPDPGDPLRTAEGLTRLLSDGSYWQRLSRLASANTQRFRWDVCSRPLFDAFCSLSEEACGQPA